MTLQAPAHAERLFLPHYLHLVHITVTTYATHASANMSTVIEISVIAYFMHAHPGDGRSYLAAIPGIHEAREAK